MEIADISKVRPRRDWLLVLADQRRDKTASGLLLPGHETGVEKVTEGAGLVLSVGPGEKNRGLGLEKGVRIIFRSFIKHANRLPVEESWDTGEQKIYFLMSSDDAIGVMAPGVDVGVFSGRPEVRSKDHV